MVACRHFGQCRLQQKVTRPTLNYSCTSQPKDLIQLHRLTRCSYQWWKTQWMWKKVLVCACTGNPLSRMLNRCRSVIAPVEHAVHPCADSLYIGMKPLSLTVRHCSFPKYGTSSFGQHLTWSLGLTAARRMDDIKRLWSKNLKIQFGWVIAIAKVNHCFDLSHVPQSEFGIWDGLQKDKFAAAWSAVQSCLHESWAKDVFLWCVPCIGSVICCSVCWRQDAVTLLHLSDHSC